MAILLRFYWNVGCQFYMTNIFRTDLNRILCHRCYPSIPSCYVHDGKIDKIMRDIFIAERTIASISLRQTFASKNRSRPPASRSAVIQQVGEVSAGRIFPTARQRPPARAFYFTFFAVPLNTPRRTRDRESRCGGQLTSG